MKVDTCKHAVSAIFSSNQSIHSLTNIVGTYLDQKIDDQYKHNATEYQYSQVEIRNFNHLIHKLETLSSHVISHKHCQREHWDKVLTMFRRQLFCQLYNDNKIVRCFAKELPNGPLGMPELDEYALGIKTQASVMSTWFTSSTSKGSLLQRFERRDPSFSLLSKVRTVVLLDDSGSMECSGHSSWNTTYYGNDYNYSRNESRWQQARCLLASVAPKVGQYNHYGLDLHFLNRRAFYTGLKTSEEVLHAFDAGQADGGTLTGHRINDILDAYMSTLRYWRGLQPLNLLIITDGEANDEEVLHWSIEEHITKIVQRGYPAHQLGLEFVQVGDCQDATRHLVELEEEVSRHHRRFDLDVVGITPATRIRSMDPETLLAILVSGIDARVSGYMRQRGVNV